MKSGEYRDIIRVITKRSIKKRFPGLRSPEINEVADIIAKNIHARMYGANVDDVESPLWRKEEPTVNATEILKETPNEILV